MSRPLRPTLASLLAAAVTAVAATSAQAAEPVEPLSRAAGETPQQAPSGDPTPAESRRAERVAERRSGRCTLSLAAGPAATASEGQAVALSGRLACPEAAAEEGQAVTLLARERGEPLSEVATLETAADGSFAASEQVSASTVFIVRAFRSRSARVSVAFTGSVTLTTSSVDAGAAVLTRSRFSRSRITLTGAVTPVGAGTRVALQRRSSSLGDPWRTIAFTRTEADGDYSFTRAVRSSGEVSFRTIAHIRHGKPAFSQPLSYDVGQAQNPQLTLSSTPSPSGTGTELSGVLAAGAGHTVLLVARTAGTEPKEVAHTVSGEGGAYSFLVAPVSNTIYRVRSGKTVSAPLSLRIAPVISLQPPLTSAVVGGDVSISGTLADAPAGTMLRLEEERSNERLHTLVAATVEADGDFTLTYTFTRPGTYTLLVSSPAGATTTTATSERFTVAVTAAEAQAQGGG